MEPLTFIELLRKDIAEIRGEKADPADYLPNDDAGDEKSEFAPWNEDDC